MVDEDGQTYSIEKDPFVLDEALVDKVEVV